MKSEAKASQDMQARAEALQNERELWAKVLAPAKRTDKRQVKRGFSKLFGVA